MSFDAKHVYMPPFLSVTDGTDIKLDLSPSFVVTIPKWANIGCSLKSHLIFIGTSPLAT